MNQLIVLRGIVALGLGLLLSAGAQAQAFRTYLSASGNDANPCTLAAPCRLLPRAIATVLDGGEVWMLDSANYNTGPVNVNKSVTILAVPGALGSLVTMGNHAVYIFTPGVKVVLRNLMIVPVVGSSGNYGINMTGGASLTVENCVIANLFDTGIFVNANGASVLITDTVIRGGNSHGLDVRDGVHATVYRTTFSGNAPRAVVAHGSLAGSTTTVDIADSTIEGSLYGVYAFSGSASAAVKVSVRNSQVVQNPAVGLYAESNSGGFVTLSASNNIITNSNYGIKAVSSGAKVWASGNTVSDNNVGFENNSALFETAGNNAVRNNGTDTTGAITAIPKL